MARWQYPDVVEPVTTPVAVVVPSLVPQQLPDPVRSRPRRIGPQPSLVILVAPPTVPDFVAQQLPDPVRAPLPRPLTAPQLTFVDEIHRPFAIAWLGQPADPIRPPAPPILTEPDMAFVDDLHRPFDIAWLGQLPDPVRPPKPRTHTQPDLVFEDMLFRFFGVAWLPVYPGPGRRPPVTHTQPDLTFVDELHRAFELAWLGQLPDPTRPPRQPIHTQADLTFDDALHRPFDIAWWRQGLDPVRPEARLEPGVVVRPLIEEVPATDWLRQAVEPARAPTRLIAPQPTLLLVPSLFPVTWGWLLQHPGPGQAARPLQLQYPPVFDPSLFPVTWGWLLQAPEPLRLLRALQLQQPPIFEIPAVPADVFDWWRQALDPKRPMARRDPGLATIPLAVPIPVQLGWATAFEQVRAGGTRLYQGRAEPLSVPPVVNIGWLLQQFDPRRRRLPPQQLQEVIPHQIVVPFSWLPYLPDPARRAALRDSGLAALPFPVPPAVALEWFVQHAGLFRRPGLPQAPSLAMPLEVPIPFGWPPYLPDPLRRPPMPMAPQPQTPWDETLFPLLLEKWWQQQYTPPLPRPPRQWHVSEILHDESLFPVPPLTWHPQQYNPTLPRRPREHMLILVVIPPPFAPAPFVFYECLALWQIMFPDTWESAAAASGLIESMTAPATPSGYRSARWVPTPSGYVVAVEAVLPSGYISPSVVVATSSGVLTWGQICNAAAEAAASGFISALWTPAGSGYMKQPPTQTDRGPKSPLWDF